jgi:hypothetical protein
VFALILTGQVLALILIGTVSFWGSQKIDPETRIRARDISEDATMRSKKTALVGPPVVGVVIVLGTLLLNESNSRDTGAALGLVLLVVILLAHWSTVKRAAR